MESRSIGQEISGEVVVPCLKSVGKLGSSYLHMSDWIRVRRLRPTELILACWNIV